RLVSSSYTSRYRSEEARYVVCDIIPHVAASERWVARTVRPARCAWKDRAARGASRLGPPWCMGALAVRSGALHWWAGRTDSDPWPDGCHARTMGARKRRATRRDQLG